MYYFAGKDVRRLHGLRELSARRVDSAESAEESQPVFPQAQIHREASQRQDRFVAQEVRYQISGNLLKIFFFNLKIFRNGKISTC